MLKLELKLTPIVIYTLHNDIVIEKLLASVEKLTFVAEPFYPTCSIALFPEVVFFSIPKALSPHTINLPHMKTLN